MTIPLESIVIKHGQWVVTTRGLECLTHPYLIPTDALWRDWLTILMAEEWVWPPDLATALEDARDWHGPKRSKKWAFSYTTSHGPAYFAAYPLPVVRSGRDVSLALRFSVFKRDGYRCQICGRNAQDDVKLELDHKVPVVKGGSNDESNLWTLCWDCNRGKRDADL